MNFGIQLRRKICAFRVPGGERGRKGQNAYLKKKKKKAETFLNLERDLNIQVHKSHRLPKNFNSKNIFSNHIVIKLQLKQNENSKATREKTSHTRTSHPHANKVISRFLRRNLTGQDRVGWCIQIAGEVTPTTNTLHSEVIIQEYSGTSVLKPNLFQEAVREPFV